MNYQDSTTIFRSRWFTTIGATVLFGSIGFAIGWSIETQHPEDRQFYILIPTSAFAVLGMLVGYVTSLMLAHKFKLLDAVISFAIPFVLFTAFATAKSGSKGIGLTLAYCGLALLILLIYRFMMTIKLAKQSSENET